MPMCPRLPSRPSGTSSLPTPARRTRPPACGGRCRTAFFQPHEKTNPIRTILVHQLLSERRFFAQFVGTEEPPVEELLERALAEATAARDDLARAGQEAQERSRAEERRQ